MVYYRDMEGDKMKSILYVDNEKFIAGTTLKDDQAFESNNMALHICNNTDNVLRNRQNLVASLNCNINQLICTQQTHSANFHKVTRDDLGRGADNPDTAILDTDALYTYEPNLILSSFTADCVPVIFYNETKGLIGVVHSGWQGTVKEITLKLFKHLVEVEQCDPRDFHVQIGIALSQEKFEVDTDVYTQFKDLGYADEFMYFNENTQKYHIDNQQTVKKQCELAGIPQDQISVDTTCTFTSPDCFSYRQDAQCGRHLSFIMKKKD